MVRYGVSRILFRVAHVRSLVVANSVLNLTKSRVEHIKSHAVAFFRSSDCHESLVAIVLRLVNLDHAVAHLPNLIDLLSTLANNGANHVIGDVDLLSDGAAGYRTAHRLSLRSTAVSLRTSMWRHVRLNVRSSSIGTTSLRTTVVHRHGWVGLGGGVRILLRVGRRRHVVRAAVIVAGIVLASSVVARSRLRAVRHDLHTSRDGTGRSTASGGICRCGRAAESVVELLQKGATHVVSRNVDSIGNTHNHQRSLARHGEAGIRRVQAGTGGLLNLADTSTTLTDDGTDQDVRNQQAQGIRLGGRG